MSRIEIKDNKKVLYVGYPCIDDGETDFIYTEDIKDIVLDDDTLGVFGAATGRPTETNIEYRLEYDSLLDIVKLFGRLKDIETFVTIEPEEFIDNFADSIYSDSDFNDSELIIKNKSFMKTLLSLEGIDNGIIETNQQYTKIVKLFNEKDQLVGFGQSFSTNNEKIIVEYIISTVVLSELEIKKVEILNKNKSIILNDVQNLLLTENEFKKAEFEIKSIEVEENNNSEYDIKFEANYEKALSMYLPYLPSLKDLLTEDNNTNDDLELDFDFVF